MISGRGICKAFGERLVLENVDIAVGCGEVVSLLGASGCGKTTLLRILAGLERADSGLVRRASGRTGFLFQQRELLPWRSVSENIELGMEFLRIGPEERRRRSQELVQALGLKGAEHLLPPEISGGMAMRTGLAQVLATRPELLFLDEPLTGLDLNGRRTASMVIKSHVRSHGSAALIVTHSIEKAVLISDRVLILSANPGRISAALQLDEHNRATAFQAVLECFSRVNPLETAHGWA